MCKMWNEGWGVAKLEWMREGRACARHWRERNCAPEWALNGEHPFRPSGGGPEEWVYTAPSGARVAMSVLLKRMIDAGVHWRETLATVKKALDGVLEVDAEAAKECAA